MSIPISKLPPRLQLEAIAQLTSKAMAKQFPKPSPPRLRQDRTKVSPFTAIMVAAGIPVPTLEHVFHPERKWRFDFAWPEQRIALEIDGGVWTQGRHTRGAGFLSDMEKLNEAQLLGWRVYRCTPEEFKNIRAIALLKRAFSIESCHA